MKIIDLLNKIAKGEELPKKIKHRCDTYILYEEETNKYKYVNVEKDYEGYTRFLFQDWIIDAILNDEIEIIEEVEDKEYEDIEELMRIDTRETSECICKIQDKINSLIRNQKYILERLDK